MKVGLSTCGKTVDEKFFSDCARAGIACVELTIPGKSYESFDYARAKSLADKYGIEIRSCHLPFMPFSELDISSPDEELRSKTVKRLKGIIDLAGDVGIKYFIVHPSAEPNADEDRNLRICRARRSLSELQDEAEKFGGKICAENLPRSCIGRSSFDIRELIKDDDRLGVCFDTNHLLGEYIPEFIRNVGSRIVTVHISDYDFWNERHWLPGEGKIDWQELYHTLLEVGYEGPWLYEIDYDAPESIVRARDLIPEDFVRNARETENNLPFTVLGTPKENLGFWD